MLTALVAVAVALAVAVAFLVWDRRHRTRLQAEHLEHLYRTIAMDQQRLSLRDQRVRELEDALYSKHAVVFELPNINRDVAPIVETPLPDAVQLFIDGFSEPEARAEFTEEARRIIASNPQHSGREIVNLLMADATAG